MLRPSFVLALVPLLCLGVACHPGARPAAADPTRLASQSHDSHGSSPSATPHAPTPSAEADPRPVLTYAEAARQATALIARIGVRSSYEWDEAGLAQARAAGLDQELALRLLEALTPRERVPADAAEADPTAAGWRVTLFSFVPLVATRGALPRLYALRARRATETGLALEHALAHATGESLAPCAPPTPEELTAARASLASFTIVESRGAARMARVPTEAELADLTYLHAALAGSGAPVGEEEPATRPLQTPPANDALDRIRERIDVAERRGDARGVQKAAREYLAQLGYPGGLRGGEESNMTWGGPGYGVVMRTLAEVDELLGDFEEAADLYRRAPPGGGACGTSVAYRLEEQRKGLIRAAEGAGQCRAAVRERLYALEGSDFDYGPARLRHAGWDVARLYRAALLTIDRDAPPAELETAFDALPSPLREASTKRLRDRGTEAFGIALRAAEGLADEHGTSALPRLNELARSASTAARLEGLQALAALADVPEQDPCRPDSRIRFGSIHGGDAPRQVRPRNHECKTKLTKAEQADVIASVVRAEADPSPEVRIAVAHAIVRVAPAARARPVLRRLGHDRYARPGWSRVDTHGVQRPVLPVVEAARAGLEELDERAARR